MLKFKFNRANVKVENKTSEKFTAEELKNILQTKNPAIFFSDCDSRYWFFDFCFTKNKKEYWIHSKYISGDLLNFDLTIHD